MNSSQKSSCQMSMSTIFLTLVIVSVCFVAFTESLLCYNCVGTSNNDDCVVDLNAMLNTSENYIKHPQYYTNCTATNETWKYCMIETYERPGSAGYQIYHRGCHDGETFREDVMKEDRLRNLQPNNFSTCALVVSYVICYQFCDTDFCNGPVPLNGSAPSFLFTEEPMRVGMLTFEIIVTVLTGWISGSTYLSRFV